ncbi:MAG: 9-O-acetylesterase [Prevotella sp.]|nr:9-O-acetylesterase [Prevotella sp.]
MKKLFILMLLAVATTVSATVKLQPLFTSNMVLQQQTGAPIWGEAQPGKNVIVTTSWDNVTYQATADSNGKWLVKVYTPKAGGPYKITISDGKMVVLDNVMIGEVWICSGQSNMEMMMNDIKNAKEEIANATNHPNMRLLKVLRATSREPMTTFEADGNGWQVSSPEWAKEFSAVAYFFGRELEKYRDVPVGLIETCWGGTDAKAWTSHDFIEQMPDFYHEANNLDSVFHAYKDLDDVYRNDWQRWFERVEPLETKQQSSMNGNILTWTAPEYDDTAWFDVSLPGLSEEPQLVNYDGIYWLRKHFNVPARWRGKALKINLGMVDDHDQTFFNGKKIGHSVGVRTIRSYDVPASEVKSGKATIALRILDGGGATGVYGFKGHLSVSCGKDTLLLDGTWKGCTSATIDQLPKTPSGQISYVNISTLLYNAMLAPLIPYAMRGAIWYQGEENAPRAYQYRDLLPIMIRDWRDKWKTDFPFYIVQLANYMPRLDEPNESDWAELREAQAMTTRLENTAMSCTIDIGEADDIHPKNKQEVGRRLGLLARALTYGEKIAYSGPIYEGYRIEGNRIRLHFSHTTGGLKPSSGRQLKGFAIAGADHKFHWAYAYVDGNDIVVTDQKVPVPVAVRYGWANNPDCNVVNGEGLPMFPFRTDDWQGITYGKK